MLTLMWFTWAFSLFAGGQSLTFTLQNYSKDPRIIAIVTTITGTLMLAPLISYTKAYFIRLIAKGKLKKWGTMEMEAAFVSPEQADAKQRSVLIETN